MYFDSIGRAGSPIRIGTCLGILERRGLNGPLILLVTNAVSFSKIFGERDCRTPFKILTLRIISDFSLFI